MNCLEISPKKKKTPASGANISGAKQYPRRAQPVGI